MLLPRRGFRRRAMGGRRRIGGLRQQRGLPPAAARIPAKITPYVCSFM
jgi:hypothetical protein